MDRTVLSIPNGQLAETRTENFAPRERIRMRAVLGLEYGTPAEKMRAVRDGIDALLRGHPLVWQDRVVVRFYNFGSYSLDIEVFCWIVTTDVDQFRAIREELFLGMMEVVQRSGVRFAFPTQTVHLAREG